MAVDSKIVGDASGQATDGVSLKSQASGVGVVVVEESLHQVGQVAARTNRAGAGVVTETAVGDSMCEIEGCAGSGCTIKSDTIDGRHRGRRAV